jgi:hypothetical protein
MIAIELTQGYQTVVDDIDSDLAEKRWYVIRGGGEGRYFNSPYAYRSERKGGKKQSIRLHRVILERILQRPLLCGEQVDHANRDRLDNRRCNLRLATRPQNNANQTVRAERRGLPTGVYAHGEKYRAQIKVNGRYVHLGMAATPEEAHAAFASRHVELYGEFSPYASESDGNASPRDEGAA